MLDLPERVASLHDEQVLGDGRRRRRRRLVSAVVVGVGAVLGVARVRRRWRRDGIAAFHGSDDQTEKVEPGLGGVEQRAALDTLPCHYSPHG